MAGEMAGEKYGYLEGLFCLAARNRKIQLCLYDISGILQGTPQLHLPASFTFHHAPFCEVVKKSPKGMNRCMWCKGFSFRRILQADRVYTGRCYMGLTEIVRPLFINGRLSCVLYIGNLTIREELQAVKERIIRNSHSLGVGEEALTLALAKTQEISRAELPEYIELAELLVRSIDFAYRSSRMPEGRPDVSPPRGTNHIVQAVLEYAHANYPYNITLEQLAKLYFISPNYLRSLFRKNTGLKFTDYLNRYRVEKAVELLGGTDERVIDIANRVGFENVTYFNRLIRRYTGLSPGQFRNRRS